MNQNEKLNQTDSKYQEIRNWIKKKREQLQRVYDEKSKIFNDNIQKGKGVSAPLMVMKKWNLKNDESETLSHDEKGNKLY